MRIQRLVLRTLDLCGVEGTEASAGFPIYRPGCCLPRKGLGCSSDSQRRGPNAKRFSDLRKREGCDVLQPALQGRMYPKDSPV
jgi:hypothetical protein